LGLRINDYGLKHTLRSKFRNAYCYLPIDFRS
jgi:hypothetical protein